MCLYIHISMKSHRIFAPTFFLAQLSGSTWAPKQRHDGSPQPPSAAAGALGIAVAVYLGGSPRGYMGM